MVYIVKSCCFVFGLKTGMLMIYWYHLVLSFLICALLISTFFQVEVPIPIILELAFTGSFFISLIVVGLYSIYKEMPVLLAVSSGHFLSLFFLTIVAAGNPRIMLASLLPNGKDVGLGAIVGFQIFCVIVLVLYVHCFLVLNGLLNKMRPGIFRERSDHSFVSSLRTGSLMIYWCHLILSSLIFASFIAIFFSIPVEVPIPVTLALAFNGAYISLIVVGIYSIYEEWPLLYTVSIAHMGPILLLIICAIFNPQVFLQNGKNPGVGAIVGFRIFCLILLVFYCHYVLVVNSFYYEMRLRTPRE